ncbi:MAG: hypothetical protein J6G98_01915 [Bacilli bacterium]|nr:hypothetical protein [Bacilli bacterium]
MKYEFYNIKGYNCVLRSLSKILNRDINVVKNELIEVCDNLNINDYNSVEVFEEYMRRNNIYEISEKQDIKIKDLSLEGGKYIIFCYDKKDFYHMVTIMDNIVYDKSDESLDLFVIKVYKMS